VIEGSLAVAGFLFLVVPPYASSIWALYSSEPLIPFLAKQHIHLPSLGFSPQVITIPIGFGLLCLVAWALLSRDRGHYAGSPSTPPLYVAIKQLKSLLAEGDQMANMFQVPGAPKPTLAQVVNWKERVNQCAEQHTLTERLDPSDIKKFNQKWNEMDVLRIESLLHDVGYFDNLAESARPTFRFIWGYVKRLEELIATVERAPSDHTLLMIETSEKLFAMLEERLEVRRQQRLQSREVGPKVVPPRQTAEERHEAEARVSYEETTQIIDIFKDAPRVKVAVTSISSQAGEEFKPVMERAGWLCDAFIKAGVNATISLWGNLGAIPDGTSIWWVKNHQNNDMAERIVRAAKIKGLHPKEVVRPVSAGECEVELMIGRNPTRLS
jgi:hypothetical protein